MLDVLKKFHANQFRFDNGADARDKEFASSAVYKFLSRTNQSCAPSMGIVPARHYARQHGTDSSSFEVVSRRALHAPPHARTRTDGASVSCSRGREPRRRPTRSP